LMRALSQCCASRATRQQPHCLGNVVGRNEAALLPLNPTVFIVALS